MPLYLIGENLDKARGHYQAETGKLVQLMRGIYVDAADNVDRVVLGHAVRIARYLYPKAYLSGASAALLGPTPDGRLFLSARRNQRTRIRALEIIQNQAPDHPSVAEAVVEDELGEVRVTASSTRQRFLEAFRLRSEHASAISDELRAATANQLIEDFGSARAAADAIWALARENRWLREGEAAERFLLQRPEPVAVVNKAELDLIVAWHGAPIGRLTHDGFEWRWKPIADGGPQLVRQTTPGKLPPFIVSLLPEGWLGRVLQDKNERETLRSGKRYMSNVTIVERERELAGLPPDLLLTRLHHWTRDDVFTGRYAGPNPDDIESQFERALAQTYRSAETPRLSGIQIKAPMFLGEDGKLSISTGKPFTHILKPAGTGGFESLPIAEWLALALGRAAGFEVPATALLIMPDRVPPALIVERFDIRESLEDRRMFALEDFCSVLDLTPEAKYEGTIERMARALRSLSTAPEDDLLVLMRRALFAWLIADGDMHLKNVALLKIAQPGDETFRSVRIAPLYDAVTTRVFPGLEHDRLALKLNGKDENLSRKDFRTFASTVHIAAARADTAIDELVERVATALDEIRVPEVIDRDERSRRTIRRVLEVCRGRVDRFR